ncbi:hypothetical protein [Paraburkholderia phosphatilytica]|uniref:hypothetical protein n=1 Tax=Paraburkholderia phosphatilytica TaxID=2282883 RepID=UPI000F5D836F|nr:hypothetical protein [Paraburkholderia phosphatilytica]
MTSQKVMYVSLWGGTPSDPTNWALNELTQWIYGQVDTVEFDPEVATITLKGRDLTRVFQDAKTTEKWQNKTSSQIATLLAKRHGLTPVVTATSTQVGKFYQIDHDKMTNARTEWDILCELARFERYTVYVQGTSLYFQPIPDSSAPPSQILNWFPRSPVNGFPIADYKSIKFTRALTVSKGIVVVVRSLHDKMKRSFTAIYPGNSIPKQGVGSQAGSEPQVYYFNVPNKTQQQCVQLAQAKYQELVQHEMKCDIALPAAGNDGITKNSSIGIRGTGTAFDQTYYPDTLKRSLDIEGGYCLTIGAKNMSPDAQDASNGQASS